MGSVAAVQGDGGKAHYEKKVVPATTDLTEIPDKITVPEQLIVGAMSPWVVTTPNYNIILLLLSNCNFPTMLFPRCLSSHTMQRRGEGKPAVNFEDRKIGSVPEGGKYDLCLRQTSVSLPPSVKTEAVMTLCCATVNGTENQPWNNSAQNSKGNGQGT
ncbi:hypothetical protein STEG23_018535, partial [Scotinomys teguina]